MSACCPAWAESLGSSREGYYGALLDCDVKPAVFMGSINDPVLFCPWCGDRKETSDTAIYRSYNKTYPREKTLPKEEK